MTKTIPETCDIWDTDYNAENWEPEFMTLFVTWQLRVTLDSICNSCDVFLSCGARIAQVVLSYISHVDRSSNLERVLCCQFDQPTCFWSQTGTPSNHYTFTQPIPLVWAEWKCKSYCWTCIATNGADKTFHMVRIGELSHTKKNVGGVECFGPILLNRFTPKTWTYREVRGFRENARKKYIQVAKSSLHFLFRCSAGPDG